MPRSKPDLDFEIHVDSSCPNTPTDGETSSSFANNVDNNNNINNNRHRDTLSPDNRSESEYGQDEDEDEDDDDEGADPEEMGNENLRHSIETDDEMDVTRQNDSHQDDEEEQQDSYVDQSELYAEDASHISDSTSRGGDGDESGSQPEGTDEDVFTDKSPRSSMGSYDAGSDSGKGSEMDNQTTINRSSRLSDISQYDKEEGDFVSTVRGTPRASFRTSDVRAMQTSSPVGSVVSSPRSSRKPFPTVSRLGTPSVSAQYSPKRKSTPPRFKSHQEAPLILLHATLLPLRWVWGDLVNNLDPEEMSEQTKTLRNSWRLLQDRVGDTVIERGILLSHPQNDYEVLEERLLEALDLPLRRRAMILECGHYLGPSNESTLTEDEESGDDRSEHTRGPSAGSKRHWCVTCKSDIGPNTLGDVKVFRVKVYASNGLMRAGAWEACWKEMERVDVELEPIVEPAVQDEIVRLAAVQQEREMALQEETDIPNDAAMQYEDQRLRQGLARAQAQSRASQREAVTDDREAARRRRRGEEKLRADPHGRVPSAHRVRPQSKESSEQALSRPPKTVPGFILHSVRVLVQDRKNVIIVALTVFVLVLSLRSTPTEPPYEPIIHRLKPFPEVTRLPVVNTHPAAQDERYVESAVSGFDAAITPSTSDSVSQDEEFLNNEVSYDRPSEEARDISTDIEIPEYGLELRTMGNLDTYDLQAMGGAESQDMEYWDVDTDNTDDTDDTESQTTAESSYETSTAFARISTVYGPCTIPTDSPLLMNAPPAFRAAVMEGQQVREIVEEIEITTEMRVVKVVQTVTTTRTQTEVETLVVKPGEAEKAEEAKKEAEAKVFPMAAEALITTSAARHDPMITSDPEVLFKYPMAAIAVPTAAFTTPHATFDPKPQSESNVVIEEGSTE